MGLSQFEGFGGVVQLPECTRHVDPSKPLVGSAIAARTEKTPGKTKLAWVRNCQLDHREAEPLLLASNSLPIRLAKLDGVTWKRDRVQTYFQTQPSGLRAQNPMNKKLI